MESLILISNQAAELGCKVSDIILKRFVTIGVTNGDVPLSLIHVVPGESGTVEKYQISKSTCLLTYDTGTIGQFTSLVDFRDCPLVGGQYYAQTLEKAENWLRNCTGLVGSIINQLCVKSYDEMPSSAHHAIYSTGGLKLYNGKVGHIREGYAVTFEIFKEILEEFLKLKWLPSTVAAVNVLWQCERLCCLDLQQECLLDHGIKIAMTEGYCQEKVTVKVVCDGQRLHIEPTYASVGSELIQKGKCEEIAETLKKIITAGDELLNSL